MTIKSLARSTIKNNVRYQDFLAGNPTYIPFSFYSIATATVTSGGTTSITFSSIPSTYTHLQIRGIGLGTGFAYSYLGFNSDTAANYSYHQINADGATTTASGVANATLIYALQGSSNASYPASGVIDILDYTNTNKYKTVKVLSGYDKNGSGEVYLRSGNWRSTSAITSITITSSTSFDQYSSFALYGVK
jgi:hypothetical protein